ncbi:sensor histidine kinase [Oceanisphaera avium]|nr:ATP-binding protein [Oceanisphaera avium]
MALIILVTTLVIILAVLSTGYHMLVKGAERQLRNQQSIITARAAEQVAQLLALRANTLAHIGVQLSSGQQLHPVPTLKQELARQRQINGFSMFPDGIIVLDNKGIARAESVYVPQRIGTDYGQRAHVQQALQTGQVTMSQPVIGLRTGQPLMNMVQPILSDEGEVLGLLMGIITLRDGSLLPEQSVRQARREGISFKIIDTHNQLYIYDGAHQGVMTQLESLPTPLADPLVDAAFSGFSNGITDSQPNAWLYANARLDALNWVFISAVPYSHALAPAKAFFIRFAGISLGLGAILSALAFWLVWLAIRPLDRMTQQIRTMSHQVQASRPQETVRLSEQGVTEVASLAQAFNQLTDERQALSELKDDFIAVISHELRTPLTSINGALKLTHLGHGGPLPKKAAELTALALRNGERLQLLINDLLDFNKLSKGKMSLTPVRIDIAELVAQTINSNQPMAMQHQVQLCQDNVESLLIYQDPLRLRQVLDNLVSNAIKYSPAHGQVNIKATKTNDHQVRITVSDQGAGISNEFAPFIFERFAQAEHGNMRAQQGTGLGLTICKNLVSLMQGEIGFYNAEGAHFWVDLPLNMAAQLNQETLP